MKKTAQPAPAVRMICPICGYLPQGEHGPFCRLTRTLLSLGGLLKPSRLQRVLDEIRAYERQAQRRFEQNRLQWNEIQQLKATIKYRDESLAEVLHAYRVVKAENDRLTGEAQA